MNIAHWKLRLDTYSGILSRKRIYLVIKGILQLNLCKCFLNYKTTTTKSFVKIKMEVVYLWLQVLIMLYNNSSAIKRDCVRETVKTAVQRVDFINSFSASNKTLGLKVKK